ncbi:MAG: isoamylase early set domain-containing protein [Candidatus Eisenbacteria bacterium]|nr:isoamylase early set domain-containing protein [Candidatus Eisenbacteria bacterium]
MIRALRCLAALLVVSSLTSCAGGWKNGVPPQGLAEGSAAVAAPAKAAKTAAAAPQATADGMTFKYSGAANTVALAGEFNAWSTSADPLAKGSDGVWAITKKLAPGRYAYKFVIDGGTWKDDPSAKESVDDGFGGKNSIAVVGAGASAGTAMAAVAPAAAAPAAATGDGATFRYTGAGNTVNLAGEFNAWSTSADPLTKGADGVWTITKKLAAGRYAYKFVVDGSNWKEDPAAKETVDDGFGGKNAIMVVGAGAAAVVATPAAAPAAAAVAGTGTGTTFRYSGAGNTVHLAGEFNAWSTSADALTKGADGVWTITKPLAAGRYAYKFVVDGSNWKEDPAAKETVDDGFGGKNAIAVVGAGAGSAAPAAAAAAAPAAAKAVTGKGKAPVVSAAGVVFTYAGSARTVSLCGSFNDWAPIADPMPQQADGTWTITKKLKAGSHSYKFLVDGAQWKTDEANKTSEDDGFGGKNSVLVVK